MTTIRQLIADGMREAGIIAVGAEPEAAEQEEGFRRLQNIIDSLFGTEMGENLLSYNFGSEGLGADATDLDSQMDILAAYVPMNARLILNNATVNTLYLHPSPRDGARISIIDNGGNLSGYNVTLDGNGRHIELVDTVVLNTNNLNRQWFYRADLASWVRVSDLELFDESPLPREFDDFLITSLALRLNPRYGAETKQEMLETLKRQKNIFKARYRQTEDQSVDEALIRLSRLSKLSPTW